MSQAIALPLAAEPRLPPRPGYWGMVGGRLRRDPVTILFTLLLLAIVAAAIFAPLLTPFDPFKESVLLRLKPFGYRAHWLGTDELGRDILARILLGGRVTLLMGVLPVVIATAVGATLGIVAGYAGGWIATLIMRVMDVFYAFPSVLLAVAISGAMGGGMVNGIFALSLVFIPALCRVAETATTQVRNLDFVEAARATGAGHLMIIRHHLLGNVLAPVLVYSLQPGQRQHPARLRPLLPRPRRPSRPSPNGASCSPPCASPSTSSPGSAPSPVPPSS